MAPTAANPATIPTPSSSPSAQPATTVVIRPPSNGSLLLHGAYPHTKSRCVHHAQPTFDARYPGTLTAARASDGTITLTLSIPFERYLEGIAEVPPSWPPAALQAQAIAARSFALAQTGWTGSPGETLHSTICATTSCQVYRGLPVQPQADFDRWVEAVQATSGKLLLYGGKPADTVYFSTSNGHTYGNETVFDSAPLPYLRPTTEHDDGASPESHWNVTLPFGDLARFLRAAGEWPSGPGISTVLRHGTTVVVSGHGAKRSMDLGTFRNAVNAWAPCLEPGRYPSNSSNGSPLPQAVPSVWFSVGHGKGTAVLKGRGWGHGVGMVQWGAFGRAKLGRSAGQILAHYYGGLKPKPFPEPGVIQVQVAEGLTSLSVMPSGSGATLDGQPLAPGGVLLATGPTLFVTPQPSANNSSASPSPNVDPGPTRSS